MRDAHLQCLLHVMRRYKFKYLSAVTASMPAVTLKDNYGSKLTIDCHGLLRVQHILNLRHSSLPSFAASNSHGNAGTAGAGNATTANAGVTFSQQFPNSSQDVRLGSRVSQSGVGRGVSSVGRTSYVEFYVAPEEEDGGEMEDGLPGEGA